MNILFLDCETTGIPNFGLPADDPSQPRVCSLAALMVDDELDYGNCRWKEEFVTLIKPDGWTIPEETSCIHGITTEIALAKGIPAVEAMSRLGAMMDRADRVAAYNVRFDLKMARGELRRAGFPDRFGLPTIDIMRLATDYCQMPPTAKMVAAGFKKPKPPKLHEAVERILGRKHEGAHDARADAMACIDIYRAIKAEKGAAHVEAAVRETKPPSLYERVTKTGPASERKPTATIADDPMPPI